MRESRKQQKSESLASQQHPSSLKLLCGEFAPIRYLTSTSISRGALSFFVVCRGSSRKERRDKTNV